MGYEIQFARIALWASAWISAYLVIGLALAWKAFPKWHLSAMRKYVENQYDYYLRISKEPGISESLAAQYRKEMRECAAKGEVLKKDLPRIPFSHWWVTWPAEILACVKMEAMAAKVRRNIRSWDAKRAQ